MIYQKDWLMRQIEQMVDAVTHLLLQTATTATITQTTVLQQREEIEKLLRAGEICKAEDWLYESRNADDPRWLQLAVSFYSELNHCSDAYLTEHNFSREEVLDGLREVCGAYGWTI